ncbi:uncharacterized protein PAE49_011442 isoform 2-T2 [Odontesthes bonariensis]|uniref:uncharacterized protein LOC142389875 isoform X2 n=1 Tax=Odontesthes bonariensis TaxID=219752 RepID=UPI003F588492
MSFLTIPNQEGLFTTVRAGKSAEEAEARSRTDTDDNDDDDEDDDSEDVRFIPRCSPVPRKRGASIFDETAEYMRIHQALIGGKRVSFADTTGGDLVDVREFVLFDSDDEESSEKWEKEEAKYRHLDREPTYTVHPEFHAPSESALLQAVRARKVEVENISPVEDEPLAFSGLISVLNISFHKAVYIRATMDHWATYFDHPAEYVHGSNDGETDQFSFKLSFAPPYITHGSRIEFVVRYETSDGDYWANNKSMNYATTLLLSYEDDSAQASIGVQHRRSILKAPQVFSVNDDFASEDEQEQGEGEEPGTSKSELVRPTPVFPVIIQPEIDVETAVHPSGSSVPSNHEAPSVDGTQSTHTASPGEQFPCTSSETTLQTNSAFVPCASKSAPPNKSQPLPRLHCELHNHTSEKSIHSSSSALPPALTHSLQESIVRLDNSQAERKETRASETSLMRSPATETNLSSTTEDHGMTEFELPAKCVSCPSVTQGFEPEVAEGVSELAERLSEGATSFTAPCVGSTPASLSPMAETLTSMGGEDEAPSSQELTESRSQDAAPQSVSAWEETENAPCISPETLSENEPNILSENSGLQSELNVNLMPCVFFLSGVLSLSIVMQEPSALFIIGLLLVLRRL